MANPLDEIVSVAVHPGIGIARVGNAAEYYIGPEAPGHVPDPGGEGGPGSGGGAYKAVDGAMKAQAARFRVFGFDRDGRAVAELTSDNATVEWTVHVRNMKAANYAFRGRYFFDPAQLRNSNIQGTAVDGSVSRPVDRDKLIIDPGPKTISGSTPSPVPLTGGSIYDGVDPTGAGLPLPRDLPFCPPLPPDPDNPEMVLVKYRRADVDLGRLETDDHGRLVFVPGIGKSESCTEPEVCIHQGGATTDPITGQYSYFNVPGWYDDTCGGSIDASVTIDTIGGPKTFTTGGDPLKRGWVGVAPPKFSPWTYNMVSLLDLQVDLYPELDPAGDLDDPDTKVDFYRDIYPTLETATHYGWTSADAFAQWAHAPKAVPGDFVEDERLKQLSDPDDPNGVTLRHWIWSRLRHGEPDNVPAPPQAAPSPPQNATQRQDISLMPKLWGSGGEPAQNERLGVNAPNQFLSLTTQQLKRFEKWKNGDFVTGSKATPIPIDDIAVEEQPRALDVAALQPTVGGGFHPGIEITYISTFPEWFAAPFRVAGEVHGLTIEPGQVNGFMAMPWQGDFWSCNTMWWPAQRPEIVVETKDGDERRALNWFRGDGIPNDASTRIGYAGGFNAMVDIWHKLGVVAQVNEPPNSVGGENAFAEFERDPSLDTAPVVPPDPPCFTPIYDDEDPSSC